MLQRTLNLNLSQNFHKEKSSPALSNKQGAKFNRWLKENIPEMKPNRFINIWKAIHKKINHSKDIFFIEEYLRKSSSASNTYNYYYLMYLIDNFKGSSQK